MAHLKSTLDSVQWMSDLLKKQGLAGKLSVAILFHAGGVRIRELNQPTTNLT